MSNVINKIIQIDRRMFAWINSLAGNFRLFDAISVIFAEGMVYLLGSGVIVYILSLERTDQRVRLFCGAVAVGLLARFGFVSIMRMIEFRFRPFWYQSVTQLVSHNPYEASFPSGHAAVMGALATYMFLLDKKWGMVFAVLAILSGVARVIVGVHFPFDILVGFACGVLSALIVKFVMAGI